MEGPFARSKIRPSGIEELVAAIIWGREGRDQALSIAEIIRLAAAWGTELNERGVKEIVHQLRRTHRVPIGSRRGESAGYFRMMDYADFEAGLGAYRRQVIEGWQVLRAVAPEPWVRELRGQLVLEGESELGPG